MSRKKGRLVKEARHRRAKNRTRGQRVRALRKNLERMYGRGKTDLDREMEMGREGHGGG